MGGPGSAEATALVWVAVSPPWPRTVTRLCASGSPCPGLTVERGESRFAFGGSVSPSVNGGDGRAEGGGRRAVREVHEATGLGTHGSKRFLPCVTALSSSLRLDFKVHVH